VTTDDSPPERVLPPRPVADPLQKALELAYRHLNRRERTVDELRRHLLKHGTGAGTTEAAIQTLVDAGYLDDARYARLFAQDKRELDQWGSDRIRRTLLERGVAGELVDAAVADHGPQREVEQAVLLLRRRFPHPPRERRDRDRALGMLLRKGYDTELALEALAAYGQGAEDVSCR
jgi:regulatory protein